MNVPATISYGIALSSTQLNATANVAGTFTYLPAAGTVLKAGTQDPFLPPLLLQTRQLMPRLKPLFS